MYNIYIKLPYYYELNIDKELIIGLLVLWFLMTLTLIISVANNLIIILAQKMVFVLSVIVRLYIKPFCKTDMYK